MISPELLTIHPAKGILALSSGNFLLGKVLVLPKSQYSHERRRLERIDRLGRQAAFQKTKFESHFSDPLIYVDTLPQTICEAPTSIWSWDRRQVVGRARLQYPALPEPMCRIPMFEGARLVQAIEGFDGELWIANKLVASRWWPREPDQPSWLQFVRSSGIRKWSSTFSFEEASQLPSVEQPRWRSDLILGGTTWRWRINNISLKGLTITIVCMSLICAVFLGGQLVRIHSAIQKAEQELASKSADAEEWLPLRQAALRNRAYIAAVQSNETSVALISAIDDLAKELDARGQQVDLISLSGDRLTVRLDPPGLNDPVATISSLEAAPHWTEVSYDSGRREISGVVTP